MSHPSDEKLVLYLLGDQDDREQLQPHVSSCDRCRREIDRLRRLLGQVEAAPVPEPDAGFEERIWARQRQALLEDGIAAARAESATVETPAVARFWNMRRMLLAGALAASLVLAFLAGLYTPRPGAEITPTDGGPGKDRVLLVALGDHLERTRMVLVELANASDLETFRAQQAHARSLIGDNRLYRQTAQLNGQPAVAEVLDEIERVLLEVARSSDEAPADELAWLRQRLADRDLLFKVSVIEGSARPGAQPARQGGPNL